MDKKVLEDINNHFENDEINKEPKSFIKKFFLISISLLLILLMISYIFVSYPIADIISGKLESSPIKNGIIELEEFQILFDKATLNHLKTIYRNEQKVEFSVCLSGEILNKETYYITKLYQPKMYKQTFNHVSFAPCTKDSLIMLHSHPYKSCLASQTDLDTLSKSKTINQNLIMVIMCESERFSVYR
jgi:proteasome lid subunit RPN8/RPN11